MPLTWLKRKYTTGKQYKNQKAPTGHSGKSRTKGKAKNKPLIGDPIMLVDMSGIDKFCAASDRLLSKHGIAFQYNGKIYVNRSVIPA